MARQSVKPAAALARRVGSETIPVLQSQRLCAQASRGFPCRCNRVSASLKLARLLWIIPLKPPRVPPRRPGGAPCLPPGGLVRSWFRSDRTEPRRTRPVRTPGFGRRPRQWRPLRRQESTSPAREPAHSGGTGPCPLAPSVWARHPPYHPNLVHVNGICPETGRDAVPPPDLAAPAEQVRLRPGSRACQAAGWLSRGC
jgi:hypothetical protein